MVLLTIADFAMMPLTTWNLLDFRIAEKEKTAKIIFVRVALVITTAVVSFSCNSSCFESY